MTFLRRRHHHAQSRPGDTGRVQRTPRQRAGDIAEEAACATLAAAGCRIVARNVRYREGELDIVADDHGTVVFVEVRMRSIDAFGGADGSIDAFKRQRIVRAAQHFLVERYNETTGHRVPACRFDVITADPSGVREWIRDAFAADAS